MGRNSELNRARVGKNDEFYTETMSSIRICWMSKRR